MSEKEYSIRYTPEAIEDLDHIYSYIAFHLREKKTAKRMWTR